MNQRRVAYSVQAILYPQPLRSQALCGRRVTNIYCKVLTEPICHVLLFGIVAGGANFLMPYLNRRPTSGAALSNPSLTSRGRNLSYELSP